MFTERPGLYTCWQDAGRPGLQEYGVPLSGPLDALSARQARWLVDMPDNHPLLEISMSGPTLRFEQNCQLAICGADLSARLNGQPIKLYETTTIRAGSVLTFGRRLLGVRAYLAVRAHWVLPALLGSCAPLTAGDSTGVLQKGMRVPFRGLPAIPKRVLPEQGRPYFGRTARLRLHPGPEFNWLTAVQKEMLLTHPFAISADSNRMGYRLQGPALHWKVKREMLSSAVLPGTIQLPASGHPIVLLNDAQTTGGYPRIGRIIRADRDAIAQLGPEDTVRFSLL